MNNDLKFSDSHTDLDTPMNDKDKKEYKLFDPINNRFVRWESLSVLESRSKQVLSETLSDNPTEEEYFSKLSRSLRKFDTVFASIFGHWKTMDLQSKWDLVQKSTKAYDKLIQENPDTTVIKALEGIWLVNDLEEFKKLIHDYWIQSFMLQYNDPNSLIGEDRKLTPLGSDVVKYALNNDIYLDLAHTNALARKEIIGKALASDNWSLLQYSHGWTVDSISQDDGFKHIADNRGISDKELNTIIKNGGLVCITPTKPFFQSLEHVVNTVDTYAQKQGKIPFGIWSDMGGLPPQLIINNMDNIEKLHDGIGDKMLSYNFSDNDVDALFRKNVSNWVKKK